MQTYRPALLTEGLYFADGQIQDEVYEYGSFLQSKMHAAGVTCSNCHNPHDLKVPVSADRVCATCHLPEKFATPAHTFHKAGSTGSSCVSCHMTTRDYMVVHARHDHSFRVPRPDLSVAIGTPNACTQCHRNKSNAWAAEAALRWWGDKARAEPHYGQIMYAAREELASAEEALQQLVGDSARPAIRRATAASMLAHGGGATSTAALSRALADPDPLVREGALTAAEAIAPAERLPLVSPLLRDPIRTVRIDAARTLASVPKEQMNSSEHADFEAALAEYVQSQLVDSDRAEAHLNLAGVYVEQGELDRAEAEYKTALALMPALGGTYVNFADLYRQKGRDDEGERILRQGLERAPQDPGIHHALGLALVRQKRMGEALKELQKAAQLPPERPRYAYVYAVALDSVGQGGRALEVLRSAHAGHPGNREILAALAVVQREGGPGGGRDRLREEAPRSRSAGPRGAAALRPADRQASSRRNSAAPLRRESAQKSIRLRSEPVIALRAHTRRIRMKRWILAVGLATVSASLAVAQQAPEPTKAPKESELKKLEGDVDKDAKVVGKDVSTGAKDVAKDTSKAAKATGAEASKVGKTVSKDTSKAAKATGAEASKVGKDVATGTSKAAKTAGADASKAGKTVAKDTSKAAKATGAEASKVGKDAATDASKAAKATDAEAKKAGEAVSGEAKKVEGKDKPAVAPTPKP